MAKTRPSGRNTLASFCHPSANSPRFISAMLFLKCFLIYLERFVAQLLTSLLCSK